MGRFRQGPCDGLNRRHNAVHCAEELKTHVRGAGANGCSWDEIRAVLKQAGVYSGAPALRSATRYANEVYREETAKVV